MIGASLTHRAHRVGEGPRLLLRDVVFRADHHPVLPGAAEQIRPPAAIGGGHHPVGFAVEGHRRHLDGRLPFQPAGQDGIIITDDKESPR